MPTAPGISCADNRVLEHRRARSNVCRLQTFDRARVALIAPSGNAPHAGRSLAGVDQPPENSLAGRCSGRSSASPPLSDQSLTET